MNHEHSHHHKMMMDDFRKKFIISLILTVPIILLSPFFQELLNYSFTFTGDTILLFALSSIVFLYCGKPFITNSLHELKNKNPGMMTLVAVAITASYAYSTAVVFGLSGKYFFWESSTLILIMLLGHWIEMRSVINASRALEKLAELIPKKAHLMNNNKIIETLVSELKAGNIILVRPGEKIPADGVIIKGTTSINESMLTGESKPVNKRINDKVIAGSANNDGSIQIKIINTGEKSYVSQVIRLVKEAQMSKSKTQNLADKAALWLTIIALTAGTITFTAWLLADNNLSFALERMITVIVITCPHALGLAIPLVVAVSTSISAGRGLLIRNRTAFEQARNTQVIIFDKTGTLTRGEFAVTKIKGIKKAEDEVLRISASLELNSEHFIARSIVSRAEKKGLKLEEVSNFKNLPGIGVQGKIKNKNYKLVGRNYFKGKESKAETTGTTAYLMEGKEMIGLIELSDEARKESKKAVQMLKNEGIKCVMLTGDNKETAEKVSNELKIDEYYAEVLPAQKNRIIKNYQSKGLIVMMVGDGVNDAPALAQSNIGVAIGAGTDVAVETGDVILTNNDLSNISTIIQLSKKTYSKMVQNLIWATGYNVITIPLAAGVLAGYGIILSPAIGAVLMSLSTVIVAVNAQLLKI
ncbi:heavy metal translocating P-type ATPase [archaeon CG_4_10_14_0_2_um_filter_Archaea_38_6]|nr:MAG: heavy metal translocating P-type ATPase [archaeon CG06_land_8_20_14_3_00_37_11]PJA22175.1 MAG: heavy metal translocating P-type ATPase [archaeon CG_4_10_14_0_2_um_filter_Archaea_38_6]